jgi:hypothetical protein
MLSTISISLIFSLFAHYPSISNKPDKTPRQLFEKGSFVYVGMENEALIERTPDMQIEIMNGGKAKVYMKIVWLDDYTYVLIQKKLVNMKATKCARKNSKIKTVITDYTEDSYTCNYDAGKCGQGTITIKKIRD